MCPFKIFETFVKECCSVQLPIRQALLHSAEQWRYVGVYMEHDAGIVRHTRKPTIWMGFHRAVAGYRIL